MQNIVAFLKHNKNVFYYVFFLTLVAHGFFLFNGNYSHDSLVFYHANDTENLGRIGQALVYFFRGTAISPVLIGALSIFWNSLFLILFFKVFKLTDRLLQFIASALVVTAFTHTYITATFVYIADLVALAECSVMLSVFLIQRYGFKTVFIPASICLSFAISIYQIHLQVFCCLCAFVLLLNLIDNRSLKNIAKVFLKYAAVALISLILYKIAISCYLSLSGSVLSKSYNSIADVGNYSSVGQILNLIVSAITFVYSTYLRYPSYSYQLSALIIYAILLINIYLVYAQTKEHKARLVTAIAFLLIAVPLATDFVYIISKGVMHGLMKFSFTLLLTLPLVLLQRQFNLRSTSEVCSKDRNILQAIFTKYNVVSVLLLALVANSIIFSNSVYIKKYLDDKATLSVVTRILYRMESFDDYDQNTTPVCFVGSLFTNQDILAGRSIIKDLNKFEHTGVFSNFSITGIPNRYFKNILNYKIKECDLDRNKLKEIADTNHMQAFPKTSAVKLIDGRMMVKLSDCMAKTRSEAYRKCNFRD